MDTDQVNPLLAALLATRTGGIAVLTGDTETTVPVAARRLTADLQTLYDRQLSADEGHT